MKTPKEPDQHPVFKNQAQRHTKLQKILAKHIEYWLPAFGLDDWKLVVDYTANNCEGNSEVNAYINCMWEYKSARLVFFLPALLDHDDSFLEVVVVHELCHALVCQMRGKKKSHKLEEATVTNLTKAFLRVKYDPYTENPKKKKV